MNIDQLQYIIEVAKYNSLSIAAKNLHVTQSTISQSISNLEKELKLKIFNRSRGYGAVLTDEGKTILRLAYEAQKALIDIKETANEINSSDVGSLKISSLPSLISFLVKAIANFRNDFPQVDLEITEKSGDAIINDVLQHKTDIGIITFQNNLNMNMDGITFKPFIQGKIKIYVSKHSPLAVFDSVTPDDILGETLVTYNGEYMKLFIQDFFQQYKPMKILYTSNNVDAILRAINENLAITFAPDFIMNNFSDVITRNIVPIELINHDKVDTTLGLIRPKDKYLPAFANKYIHYLNSELMKSYKNENLK